MSHWCVVTSEGVFVYKTFQEAFDFAASRSDTGEPQPCFTEQFECFDCVDYKISIEKLEKKLSDLVNSVDTCLQDLKKAVDSKKKLSVNAVNTCLQNLAKACEE